MSRRIAVYSRKAEFKGVPELDQDEQYTVYQIRFYIHDVVENYLKPITCVPGAAFVAKW